MINEWEYLYQMDVIAAHLFEELNENTRNAIAPFVVRIYAHETFHVNVGFKPVKSFPSPVLNVRL